jgi:large subunit ribosomal protein L19
VNKNELVKRIDAASLKQDLPVFHVGDTISVHSRIVEGTKERIQVFTGVVIGRSGAGISETFTMHRVAYGEGMERIFVLHSPRLAKIEVLQEGDVRRAKLNHIRGQTGKKAKVKRRVVSRAATAKLKEKNRASRELALNASVNQVEASDATASASVAAAKKDESTNEPS